VGLFLGEGGEEMKGGEKTTGRAPEIEKGFLEEGGGLSNPLCQVRGGRKVRGEGF